MNSRHNFQKTLNHQETEKIVLDFGASPVTGIHVLIVEKLREYFALPKKPVKVTEPFQMLGEIEDDLLEAIGIDVIGISPGKNMFGHPQENWKPFKTFWGQEVLVPGDFNTSYNDNGDLLMYPAGDMSVPPSAMMPEAGYFFDAIMRQEKVNEDDLNPQYNLEEFSLISDDDLKYWETVIAKTVKKNKGIIANFGGTGIGDIALVPGINMKNPKGIRNVAEWYMSTLIRPEYLHEVFDKQTDIAIKNFAKVRHIAGDNIDAIFICGTDFGTQDSTFCSPETFNELYAPYYKKMNDWIHRNTNWKTFKHSCGAVESLIQSFINCGFDILNPVQINAKGMDPVYLKQKYGDNLVFWGGGADTQKVLPFADPEKVKEHVKKQCDILSKGGGFVFNTVHNIQANVPVENVVAMIEAVREY